MPLEPVDPSVFVRFSLSCGKRWKIPFDELAASLVKLLGKEKAKRLVNVADILNYYGKDCLTTWNELVK